MPALSVVVPVYRSAACLPELHARLSAVLAKTAPDYELVLVEDGGRDGSWEAIETLARKDTRVKGVKLSRNFGQHAAITAGLAVCSGAWAVVMDCDLQDPPEAVPRLLSARAGVDIVYGRPRRKSHSALRRACASLFFKLLNAVQGHPINGEYGNFSAISRKTIDAYLGFHDLDRHYMFILRWLGLPSASVDYEHARRASGQSSYTLGKLLSHALSGVFFQTTRFLTWIVFFGFVVAFSGLLLAAHIFFQYFFHSVLPGWTSLSILILVIGGCTIVCTGVTGLYIGKIFDQVRGRPLYVVEKRT